jgi:FAD/FMN-containing dehydrogenase
MGGSISAEHGLGLLKQAWLHRVRSAEEIVVMRGLKQVLDPHGIMNPGKLLG